MVDQERLVEALIAFIGERTGLAGCDIRSVLDANDCFWDTHKREFMEILYEDLDT